MFSHDTTSPRQPSPWDTQSLSFLSYSRELIFVPCCWLFQRLLYVYLNYNTLNNLPISRVKRKIYDVSFWQAAADLDSCGKTIVLTAPFSKRIQEQLLQVYVAMWKIDLSSCVLQPGAICPLI